MNKFNLSAIALAVSLTFSAGAIAQNMSKDDYQVGKDKISAEYNTNRAACASFSGNKKDICIVDAKGKERVAKANLEASFKPTRKNRYNARVAVAEANYDLAKERCDDLAGNAKDVCVKEAKAVRVTAKADAKVEKKTSDANVKANEKSAEARVDAKDTAAAARKDAAGEKSDAIYAVEMEKCEKFAGGAKDNCVLEVKARFGKK